MFNAGGWGYELKGCPENEISIAVRQVFRGNSFVCSTLAGNSIRDGIISYPPFETGLLETLTPMERKVIINYKDCGSVKEISMRINRTVNTVEKHIERIIGKLGIHNQRDLRSRLIFTKLQK